MAKSFSTVHVWRHSFHSPDKEPTFSGGWMLGSDWKKKKWASRDTIIERRTVPFSALHSAVFVNGDVMVEAHRLSTLKSRNRSVFFNAVTHEPYDGPVKYTEEARDDSDETPDQTA